MFTWSWKLSNFRKVARSWSALFCFEKETCSRAYDFEAKVFIYIAKFLIILKDRSANRWKNLELTFYSTLLIKVFIWNSLIFCKIYFCKCNCKFHPDLNCELPVMVMASEKFTQNFLAVSSPSDLASYSNDGPKIWGQNLKEGPLKPLRTI